MRSEEEVRALYRLYIVKHANSVINNDRDAANQYFGASIACGRTLGKDIKRIKKDLEITEEHFRREMLKD